MFKVEGAGNDFLLGLGLWAERIRQEPEIARPLCDRHRGIGADGMLSVDVRHPQELDLEYINADGSPARFCANATRCAARTAVEVLGLTPSLVITTSWASIPARVTPAEVELDLPAPTAPPRRLSLVVAGQTWNAHYLVVGVPHLVLPVDQELSCLDIASVGPALAHHADLGPGGANVNFVFTGDQTFIRTYELGVNCETLACGSGVVAAGLMLMEQERCAQVFMHTYGADRLGVAALGTPPLCATRASGPARVVAEIQPSNALVQSRLHTTATHNPA